MAKRAKKEPEKRQNYKSGTYSRDFAVDDKPKTYLVVAPGKLWVKVLRRAKGVISIRALILGLLTEWVEGRIAYPRAEGGLNTSDDDAIDRALAAFPNAHVGTFSESDAGL